MKNSFSNFLALVIIVGGSLMLSAQANSAGQRFQATATPNPHSRLRDGGGVQGNSPANSSPASVSPQSACINLLLDPSFEAYTPNPYWGEFSSNFGTPLCTVAVCGTGGGTAGPHTGTVWGWFGGTPAVSETAVLSQTVTILTDTATLQFYFWIGTGGGGGVDDVFFAGIDNTPVFTATAPEASSYASYTPVAVNVSAFADGGAHSIFFEAFTSVQIVNFNLDDAGLCSFKVYLPLLRR